MKTLIGILLALLLAAPVAMAATKTYQVTGPVLEVRDDAIVVEKGKDKWEIARDASTKTKGDIKKGDRVTVEYRMSATDIEVKDKGKGKAAGEAKGKDKGAGAPPGR